MPTVLEEISEWATGLPFWEQAAIEKIINGVTFSDADYEELLQYLLEDAELVEPGEARPVLTFPQQAARAAQAQARPLRLKRISNLQNINALVPNQEIVFGQDLTAIFGANGSGKSGYARVIGNAAFTRGDQDVLTDITQPIDRDQPMTADIELTDGTEDTSIHFEIGQPCPDMRSFYVFDSTSVRAHLTKSNPMSFSPAGLSYLTQLAEVTDDVRRRLHTKVEQRQCPNPLINTFSPDTEVGQLIEVLNSSTDLKKLEQLAQLNPQELARIDELEQEIAKLRSQNIPEEIEKLKQAMADLDQLAANIQTLVEPLGDEQLQVINELIGRWQALDAQLEQLGETQFESTDFSQIGSDSWYQFINAAQQLAQAESTPKEPYPQPESRCLLCHQPLSAEAQNLLKRLWTFLESDIQNQLSELEANLAEKARHLADLDVDFFDEQSVSYRYLQAHNPKAAGVVQAFVQACRARRTAGCQAIAEYQEIPLTPLPANGIDAIKKEFEQLQQQETGLEDQNPAQTIAAYEKEKQELEDRKRLGQYLPEIEQYVANRRWINTARKSSVQRTTRHITLKYNQMFDRLVTQQYIVLFQETLQKLNCPLQVKIKTSASKGQTFKQIALQTDETVTPDQAAPEKVLSGGEQRAVALADFLTEVALDNRSTGVVLDDPVTSLDFDWKDTIATHLVEEARRRQVIVFTHDLHFLYCLKECADSHGINVVGHWIEKRDNKPGWVFLNNSPLSEGEYKNAEKVKDIYRKAKASDIAPEDQQRLLQDGFAALRTCYEAFVIFELFGAVVLRFGERVSVDRLKDVYIDPDIRDEVIAKVGLLSRYIEGHLHSDEYIAQKPTPDMLNQEILAYEDIKSRHKKCKKQMASNK